MDTGMHMHGTWFTLLRGTSCTRDVRAACSTFPDANGWRYSAHGIFFSPLQIYIYIVLLFLLCFRVHAHLYSHTHLKAQSHPIRCILHVFPHTCASPTQWSLPTRLCTIHRSIPRNVVVAFFCEYANISIENGYQPVTQPTTFILLSGVNWALTSAAPNPHVSRPRLAFSWHSYIHHTHQWTHKNRFFFDARPFLYQCTVTSCFWEF